jgi:hypothetical protein
MEKYKVIALYTYGLNLEREITNIAQSQLNCILPNRIECYLLTREEFIRATTTKTVDYPIYQYMGILLGRVASFKTVVNGLPERLDIMLKSPINNRKNIAYIVFRGCSDGTPLEELPLTVPTESVGSEEPVMEEDQGDSAILAERESIEEISVKREIPVGQSGRIAVAEDIANDIARRDTFESLPDAPQSFEEVKEEEVGVDSAEEIESEISPIQDGEPIKEEYATVFVPSRADETVTSEFPEEGEMGEIEYEMDEFIEIPEYDCEYDETELIESLAQELQSIDSKMNLSDAFRASQFIQDLVRKTRQYDGTGHPVRGFAVENQDTDINPITKRVTSGHYDALRIYPIVADSKKIYLRQGDNVARDDFMFHEFQDIQKTYRAVKELYRRYALSSYGRAGKMNYTEFTYHLLKGGMVEIDGVQESVDPVLLPYQNPVDVQMEGIPHFRTVLPNATLVFRGTTIPNRWSDESYPTTIAGEISKRREQVKKSKGKAEMQLVEPSDSAIRSANTIQYRYTMPEVYQLKDTYSEHYYTEVVGGVRNIKTCTGSGAVKDLFYADDDKKSDFFRSIQHAPYKYNASNVEKRELPSFKGEEVCIVGFFIPSVHHRRIITAPHEECTIVERRDGAESSTNEKYTKHYSSYTPSLMASSSKDLQRTVYPYQYETNTLQHERMEQSFVIKTDGTRPNKTYEIVAYRNFDWKNIDDEKDYYVLFDATTYTGSDDSYKTFSMTEDDYTKTVEKVIPSIPSIVFRESASIKKCRNLTDLQVVLRPYHVNVRDLTDKHMKQMHLAEHFGEIVDSIRSTRELQSRKTAMMRRELQKIDTILHQVQQHRWLRHRAIKGTQLTQYDFTDESLGFIIQEETRMILNQSSQLTLLVLLRFLTGGEPTEEDFNVDNKPMIIDRLVQYFSQNTNTANQASEFYKVFSQFSVYESTSDPMSATIEKLFQLYMELFRINQYASFGRAMYGQYDANQLKEIQMMWNLNAHNSGGRELLQLFHLVQLLKYKRYIHQSFESYGKTEYELETGGIADVDNGEMQIVAWDQLPEKRRELYYPSEKLLKQLHSYRQDIYDIYEAERKKYSEYITRCGRVRICKVYSRLDRLYADNGIDIYFDESFDTTAKDVALYQQFVGETSQPSSTKFKKKLRDLYLFDSDAEIQRKWENVERVVKTAKGAGIKKRIVIDGDICMLSQNGQLSYYQRTQKHWIRMERDLLSGHHIEMSLDWLHMTFQELSDKMESNECVTVPMEYVQIPVEMRNIYAQFIMISRKEEMVKTMVQFHRQVDSDIQQLFQYLNERYHSLLFEAQFRSKTYAPSTVYTRAIEFTKEQTNIAADVEDVKESTVSMRTRIPLVKPPTSVLQEYERIRQIMDIDIQYQKLNEFIRQYGIDYNTALTAEFVEQQHITDDTFPTNSPFHPDQANPSTATYYFYNVQGVNIPLICCHHDAFRKNVFASNEIKERLLTEVKDKWGSGTSFFSEQILCKNCGEVIDVRRYSGAEGFGRDEKAIQVRERVIDYEDIEELEKVESGITREIQRESPPEIVDLVAINAVSQIIRSVLYVKQIHMTTEDYISILQLTFRHIEKSVYDEKFKESMDIVEKLPIFKKLKPADINQFKSSISITIYLERAIAAFIHILRVSTPEYVMKGSGFERKTSKYDKTSIFNDFYHNESILVPFFSKEVRKHLVENKSTTSFTNILTVINFIYENKKIADLPETSERFNQRIQEHYTNIGTLSTIQQRYVQKEEFLKRQESEQAYRQQYGYWPTFLPSLQYSDELAITSDNLSTTYMNKVYEYLRNQPQRNVRCAAYVSYVDDYSVLSNYARDLQEKIDGLAQLYGQLQIAYDKQMSEMTNPANTIEFIVPKLMGRNLQDYMSVVDALMIGRPESDRSTIERKNMEQKWMQLNLQVHFAEDAQKNRVGIPRIYREIADDDFALLGQIYADLYGSSGNTDNDTKEPEHELLKVDDGEIAIRLEALLREKYKSYKSLEKTDEWFKFKVQVILHMNAEPNKDYNKSDPNSTPTKLTCTFDIVSGKFKADIQNEVNSRMKSLSMDELHQLILKNERYSLSINDYNMLDNRSRLPTTVELETAFIESQFYEWLRLLLPSDVLSQEIVEQVNKVRQERAILMDMEDTKEFDGYNTNFLEQSYIELVGGYRSSRLITEIMDMYRKYVSNNRTAIQQFETQLKTIGSLKPVYEDVERQISETLTIEGFPENDLRKNEQQFRQHYYKSRNASNELHVLYQLWQVIRNTILPQLSEKELFYIRNPIPSEDDAKHGDLRAGMIQYLSEYNSKYGGYHFQPDARERVARWSALDRYIERMVSIDTLYGTDHHISRLSVFHPMWMCLILRYMCYSMIMEVTAIPEELQSSVFRQIASQIVQTMTIENSITAESYEIIKKMRAKENSSRKARFEKMSTEMKSIRKVSRAFNLGNMIAKLDEELVRSAEEMFMEMPDAVAEEAARADARERDEGYDIDEAEED